MALQTWKVKLHAVRTREVRALDGRMTHVQETPHVDTFGVEADGEDKARLAARKWLSDRKFTVRSLNFSATAVRELVTYVIEPAAKGTS